MSRIHNLGFPRIGSNRELKFACEAYWAGEQTEAELLAVAHRVKTENWQRQLSAGIDLLPVGDFSLYDHILDTSALVGNLPTRFRELSVGEIDRYFAAARGLQSDTLTLPASEMTKWFDTNYHYLVPEFDEQTCFSLHPEKLINDIEEAKSLHAELKVVLPGPLTYLWLGKERNGGDKLARLPQLIEIYNELFELLVSKNIRWVQLDEPILALDLPLNWQNSFEYCYHRLQNKQLSILLASYFGPLKENYGIVNRLPVAGLHLDAVRGASDVKRVIDLFAPHKILSIGIVDGRNIWRNDFEKSLTLLRACQDKLGDRLWLAPSCSLLHVPVDLNNESDIDEEIYHWLAFAQQKLEELSILKRALNGEHSDELSTRLQENADAQTARARSPKVHNAEVLADLKKVDESFTQRHSAFKLRAKIQQDFLKLPAYPTTTIGSFPQTKDIRQVRRAYKQNTISEAEYRERICKEIAYTIQEQEKLGLDVLVHGEAERNDMVEYFGEQLDGYIFTDKGWVQSYGSRCVKPPIIYGDVSRTQSMTVDWIRYAQSLTEKPVKGMLTGPITLLQWAFVRDDQPRSRTAQQIALALRAEVQELEQAGVSIIQVDEPALREGLPLRKADWSAYLTWAVHAFKLATCCVEDSTQIHTHMCYSEFNDIIESIAALDADVITIETSRSKMKLLEAFADFNYPNGIGPGVYDIHSPNVPNENDMSQLILRAQKHLPWQQLWVNPDCGLKTRGWEETRKALQEMVNASQNLRNQHRQNSAFA